MRTVVALVQDRPGVLHRVVSLIRRRGYNIESLSVSRCEMADVSRLTLVVDGDVDQVTKQLNRLIEVLSVYDVTGESTIERETVLVKVHAPPANRAGLIALTSGHGARVIDVGVASIMFELTEAPCAVDTFLAALKSVGIRELIRTGRIAMLRGTSSSMAQADGSGE